MMILGLVKWMQPVHGYDVRRELLSWSADKWANVQPGSIYHALRKLTEEGLLRAVATEQVGARSADVAFDQVADTVTTRLEAEQVRRCLGSLTDLQRESIELAYYNGYTYPEVAQQLGAKLPTIKARMRDGLIRLRDCLGTTKGERP